MKDSKKFQSIEFEPQLKGDFRADSSEDKADEILSHRKNNPDQAVEHSVWDEPGLSPELTNKSDSEKLTYSTWLNEKIATTAEDKTWLNTLFLVLFSGIWAIFGVFILTLQGQGSFGLMAVLIIGPILEEILKISSALVTVEKKPYLFKSPFQIFVCCAMSGLFFAFTENLLYLHVYVSEPSERLVLWRWTICMLLHSGCASVSSIGLIKVWRETIALKKKADLGIVTKYVTVACVIHGLY
ncbi:MAG TPA: PrsW family glutamic-type intramembrane protease, partial [Victivallales bacterium]|nr:PrsW family glutamic-type intramembrane protease [Victivallales bacterium]